MTQIVKTLVWTGLGLLLIAQTGCGRSSANSSAALAEQRTRLVLADEPDELQTVAEVRHSLVGDTASLVPHDHDGDGIPDHAPEDHLPEHDEHAHAEHDDADHDEHAHAEHDEHDHDAHEEHAEHDHDEAGHDEAGHDAHDHDAHDHDAHDHDAHDHGDHSHASDSISVNVVGHIGGLANPWGETQPDYPFMANRAVFFLADPQAVIENEASGHVHAPGEECAFCAAHAADRADMVAMVRFVDKNGKVLAMDVRELFDVKEKDTVVVQGTARMDATGILVVDAQGLYVRK